MQIINEVGMKVDYLIVEANQGYKLVSEINEVLQKFDNSLKHNNINLNKVYKVTVFYDPNYQMGDIELFTKQFIKYFGNSVPAISIIAQPPLGGSGLIIEAVYVIDNKAKIDYKKHSNVHYSKVTIDTHEHIYISGLQSENGANGILEHAENAFIKLEQIFKKEGYSFSNIIRQWNYIEGIIDEEQGEQHYQIFNDVRTKYYDKNGLKSNYPAATGIGIKKGGVIVEVHAVKNNNNIKLAEIANPKQTDAFDYSEKVLIGNPMAGCACKTTPKFSRAKIVLNHETAQVLISGTASIIGEVTIGIDNVEEQTRVTIENMQQLIQPEVLNKHQVYCDNAADNFSYARVYIKHKNDYNLVKPICEKAFSTSNLVFVEADICRTNLLVEIEGTVVFSIGN